MRALWLLVALALIPDQGFAQAAPLVEKAERELADLEYGAALKLLDAALKVPGNDRQTLLKIFELQAVAYSTTGQDAKGSRAFNSLLSLVPGFKLAGNHPPRVTTAYYEALGWLDSNLPLEAKAIEPILAGGKVARVRLELASDPLKLVKEVRFNLVIDGKAVSLEVPVTKAISAPADGARVAWWAQLLGEKKSVLMQVGSQAAPRTDVAPGAPIAVEAALPPPAVVAAPEPLAAPPPPSVSAGRGMTKTRVTSLPLMGLGVASIAVGAYFGASAGAAAAKFNAAKTDSAGRVTDLTHKDAVALGAQQRMQATLANVFYATGLALAVGGVTLFVLGRDDGGASVALVPAGAGAALVGTFP